MRACACGVVVTLMLGLGGCTSTPADEASTPPTSGVPEAPPALEEATKHMLEEPDAAALTPPHGGVLVGLGAPVAHAEVVIIPDTGQLVVYLLDKDGQPGKRVAQPTMMVKVLTSGRESEVELKALPEAGEEVGDASRFSAQTDDLLRAGQATVTIKWVLVDGMVFSDSVVNWGA